MSSFFWAALGSVVSGCLVAVCFEVTTANTAEDAMGQSMAALVSIALGFAGAVVLVAIGIGVAVFA